MKKSSIITLALASAALVRAQVPEVSNVQVTQDLDSRVVTVQYTLSGAPGIVTVDVRTNNAAGVAVSIGDSNITYLSGDVNKVVSDAVTKRTITWLASKSWPDHKITDQSVSVKVSAWATNTPPDYMVVDLLDGSAPRYYTSAGALPDGGLSNAVYRTSRLVLRRIPAKGVEWTMGARGERTADEVNETPHNVTLSNDYYIGIFEMTQGQWANIKGGDAPSYFKNVGAAAGRPVEQVSYNAVRGESSVYPAAPASGSFLGLLRTQTGLAFDLPGEAQWEYACRAGNGQGLWNDGSSIQAKSGSSDSNLNALGRYKYNGGMVQSGTNYSFAADDCTPEHGTATVGTYLPNGWGLYDMHGNVQECCLDFYKQDLAALGGAVNTSTADSSNHVYRGGKWYNDADTCRSAFRWQWNGPADGWNGEGFRVVLVLGQ